MSGYQHKGKTGKLNRIFVAVFVISIVVAGGSYYFYRASSKSKTPPSVSVQVASTEKVVELVKSSKATGRYLFNGTIFWGRGIEHWSKGDASWPFALLGSFSRDKYDGWSADLECPVTSHAISFQEQVDKLIFNCDPQYLPEMAQYFNLIDLANNHTDNAGAAGLTETRDRLNKLPGVQYFGNYDPSVTKDDCEVVALPVRIPANEKNPETKKRLPVTFCAWHYFYRTPKDGEIETMKAYAAVMPVFAFVHMGSEYNAKATDIQVSIAHRVADAGASFVIANNPHWVQNSEAYNGKLIVYSTGNFIFDQLDYETQRSASVDLTLDVGGPDLDKWILLGDSCEKYHDDCLAQIMSQNLMPYTTKLSFAVVAGDNSGNHQTRRGSDILQKAIEERLDWKNTLKGIGQ